MKVTFVIPPSGFLLDERVFPTLGVLKVAAVREAVGDDVSVLDLSGVSDVETAVDQHMHGPCADVYGITATMPQMPAAAAIAARIKANQPGSKVILGGPHVTLMQSSARQEHKRNQPGRATKAIDDLLARFDVLICGDGERAIHLALDPGAPRLIDGDDAASPLFLKTGDMDDFPLPARHLIDVESYHYAIDGVRAQSLIAQLGCPFACNFCGGRRSPFLRRIRTRSTSGVIDEMRHLHATYGTSGFMFFDDELNVNTQFTQLLTAIQALQDELGVSFRLRGFLKSELITPPMAAAMYAAGFRQVLVGFESGHERILRNIEKKATREQNTRAVEILHENGLAVKAAMSVGHPGESVETIEASRKWLLEVQPDEFDVSIITVYPGTPYFDDAIASGQSVWTYTDRRSGDRLHAIETDHLRDVAFYKGTPGSYKSFVYTDFLSPEDLCAARDLLEAETRSQLGIGYPTNPAALQFDHSMGASVQ